MNTRIGSSTSTMNWMGAMRARMCHEISEGGDAAEQALGFDGVVAPVAEGVAAQDAPRRQHQPAKYAELPQRLRRRRPSTSARTCSDAAAPARSRAGRATIGACTTRDARPSCARPPARAARAARRARPSSPSRSASSRADGRATTTTSWPGRDDRRLGVERLAQQALDAVAVDGAADLARDRQPEARPRSSPAPRGKRVDDEVAVAVRAALAVRALELRAARQAPAARRGRGPGTRGSGSSTISGA